MTALIKWLKEATQILKAKYEGEAKPVNSSASIDGGQMTIDVSL